MFDGRSVSLDIAHGRTLLLLEGNASHTGCHSASKRYKSNVTYLSQIQVDKQSN